MTLRGNYYDILVVDDDQCIREMLTDLLEDEGYSIRGAANGQEALTYLHTHATLPRLILLDLNMPIMSGWEFRAAQLQNTRLAAIPVVVISAAGREDTLAARLSADRYLSKPLNFDLLLSIVAHYVRGVQPQPQPMPRYAR